ncbi:MAG: hypothetical protein ABSG76_01480, partial [Xanthobacteraceae bacterium]
VIAALVFGCAIAGLYVQRLLPDEHKSETSRDLLKQLTGIVGLLLALILGTVTGASFSSFWTQRSELEAFSAQMLLLDQSLAQYGTDTKPARAAMKDTLVQAYRLIWGGGDVDKSTLTVAVPLARLRAMNEFLGTLEPKTDMQKHALEKARELVWSVTQSRLLMSLQVSSHPVSWPLMTILLFWTLALFFAFGLLSRTINATVVTALAFAALSVAGAMFLILELGRPYTGLYKVSPAALQETIEFLDK